MDLLFWSIAVLAAALVVTSLLPWVPLPHGIFRVFDFPRLQSASLSAIGLVLTLVFLGIGGPSGLLALAFAVALAIQLFYIARFTILWPRRSVAYSGDPPDASQITILTCNVKMGNRDYQKLVDLVLERKPDIALFMETDRHWIEALGEAIADYPHRVACPLDNSYGMFLVSRLPVVSQDIRYLLNEEVPSFDLVMGHPDGGRFRLLGVHPEPPVPTHDTIGRDAEIALVAELVRQESRPVIVCGDLNDVAWSSTTRRFIRISRLLDPREGRGQYNTFDARYPILRWPLDHIFHSAHFQLVDMQRMPFVGSDHFPMLYTFALTERETVRREIDEATEDDREEARELIEEERQRDRRPIGADWED